MVVDAYTLKARVLPVLLVLAPISLVIMSWFPADESVMTTILAALSPLSMVMLLAQLPRDRGKRLEKSLFERWGGTPTLLMLRHRTTTLSKTTLRRYHTHLAQAINGISMPMESEETGNPEQADDLYQSCIDFLRHRTRDKDQFPLVFAENVSYGYRRNLVGMKVFGIWISIGGLLGCIGALIYGFATESGVRPQPIISSAICLTLMLLWIFAFNDQWVRTSADAYAQRLLESCESIKGADSPSEGMTGK